jgi:hypothetical protein
MTNNVRHLPPKDKAPTVEDAKRVQRLEEHLKALRRHRDFLADKRVVAQTIRVSIPLSEHELPPGLKRGGEYQQYIDGRLYQRNREGSWETSDSIHHGTSDPTQYNHHQGYLPTIGTRVMDGIRAALFDEIEATEKAISRLGFAIPNESA